MSKLNKEKINNNTTEDQSEVRKFIIILISLVVLVIIVFVFTKYVINDGDIRIPEKQVSVGSVNNDLATVGSMFNKPSEEYYVLLYNMEESEAIYYSNLISTYKNAGGEESVYYVDLGSYLNEDFLATDEKPENVNAKTIDELSFGKETMLKFEDGEIVDYYTDRQTITDLLTVKESE